jgi:hypothetical protein
VAIRVTPDQPQELALRLRIPGWARNEAMPSDLYRFHDWAEEKFAITINGEKADANTERGYAVLRRKWQAGDLIELSLPMPVRRVVANPAVKANAGRVAIQRGPVVYCVEAVDHSGAISDLFLPEGADLQAEHNPMLLGGVTVLRGQAQRVRRGDDGQPRHERAPLTAIPYFAWAHREVGEMAVWLPRDASLVKLRPAPTLASTSRASASHVWQNDTVDALNDQIEPASSIDHDIPRHTFWDHVGTQEWLQYDLAQAAMVSAVDVYWFDDTGRGRCRVPESWRLQYRDGDDWKPVAPNDRYGVAKDQFNTVRFQPVKTNALRLEVQLQPNASAGVLEWRVQ